MKRYSPYNFAYDNPLRFIDPDGMWAEDANGWSTSDPNEIAGFMLSLKHEQSNNDEGDQGDQGGDDGGKDKKKKDAQPQPTPMKIKTPADNLMDFLNNYNGNVLGQRVYVWDW